MAHMIVKPMTVVPYGEPLPNGDIIAPGAFTQESLDGLIGTPVTVDFDPSRVAGKVVDARVTEQGIEVTMEGEMRW